MKWKKLGKIFDPSIHSSFKSSFEFAQSPQVLTLEDSVRIYFSTRTRDALGKYLSHVSYIEMNKDLNGVIDVSRGEVIPLGKLGCFDEHGIFPINVVRDGQRIMAYTTGWNRRVSVSNDASIGLAISGDGGRTFTKYGDGPVLTSSLDEPFLVADAFVLSRDETYYMWYIVGVRWIIDGADADPQRVYKIVHAKSKDGIQWEKEGIAIIDDRLNADECQALPTVIKVGDRYHMYFCYRYATDFRKNPARGYRLGYAHSEDLRVWNRDDSLAGIDVSTEGWDSQMMCYPHTFHWNGQVYMLYNGNEFGRFGFGLAILEND